MARGYLLFALVVVCAAGVDAHGRSLLAPDVCVSGKTPDTSNSCPGGSCFEGNSPKSIDCPGGLVCNADNCDVYGSCEATCGYGNPTFKLKTTNGIVTFTDGPTDGTFGDIYLKGGPSYCKYPGSTDILYTPFNNGGNRPALSNTIFCWYPCVCKDKLAAEIAKGVTYNPTPDGYTVCEAPEATIYVCGKKITGEPKYVGCGKITYRFTCADSGYYVDFPSPYTIGETVEIVKDCPPTFKSSCDKTLVATVGKAEYTDVGCKFSAPLTITGSLCPLNKDYVISCNGKVTS